MSSIKKADLVNNLLHLLTETFEGTTINGNSYIDKGTGLFDTIENISVSDASNALGDNNATVAAHLEHTRFYLVALIEFINGRTENVKWNESWRITKVSQLQWDSLIEDTKQEYKKVTKTFLSIENWDDDKIGDAMAIVIHTAYHLGAIRQILKSIHK